MVRRVLIRSYRRGRKIAVGVVGGTVVALGIGMLVLPGPALLVIPLGLAILALEFAWARRLLRQLRERSRVAFERLQGARSEAPRK